LFLFSKLKGCTLSSKAVRFFSYNPSKHPLSHRPDALGVIKQLRRIILGLDLLQLPQIHTVVQLLRGLAIQCGIGVVDVHAPVALLERLGDGVDPAVEELGAVRGVDAAVDAVVELDDVELVAVGVGRVGVGLLGDGAVPAAVHVELEPPVAAGQLGCVVEPVVDKVLGGLAVEGLEG